MIFMRTTEADCIAALREAADRLGESPTKAQYEALGLTPASGTIIRVMGGWNVAKESADLETNPSTGTRIQPKPDDVSLPDGFEWSDLSVDQRWHYRNTEWNAERTSRRRARLRSWVNELKGERGCKQCREEDSACLDFHHLAEKEMKVSKMVTYGYGKDRLRAEIAKCEVLCANCHRREHRNESKNRSTDGVGDRLRSMVDRYKRQNGCEQCPEDDPVSLVFHHNSDKKRATVSQLLSDGRPERVVRAEMENCVVLCGNCHRKIHSSSRV